VELPKLPELPEVGVCEADRTIHIYLPNGNHALKPISADRTKEQALAEVQQMLREMGYIAYRERDVHKAS
jgi:hypothetical protein